MTKMSEMLAGSTQKGSKACVPDHSVITGCVAKRLSKASCFLSSGTLVSWPVITTRPQGGFSAVELTQPPDVPPSKAISDTRWIRSDSPSRLVGDIEDGHVRIDDARA